jgi:hypothetical protein
VPTHIVSDIAFDLLTLSFGMLCVGVCYGCFGLVVGSRDAEGSSDEEQGPSRPIRGDAGADYQQGGPGTQHKHLHTPWYGRVDILSKITDHTSDVNTQDHC